MRSTRRPSAAPARPFRALPRVLFWLTCLASAALISLVLLAPLLDNGSESPEAWARLLGLFARDAAVRRTATASAFGLLVTACIFFRRPGASRPPIPVKRKPSRLPPPPHVAGA